MAREAARDAGRTNAALNAGREAARNATTKGRFIGMTTSDVGPIAAAEMPGRGTVQIRLVAIELQTPSRDQLPGGADASIVAAIDQLFAFSLND